MYQLPHELDRKHQLETAQKIIQSRKKFIIVRAPTGSGKTSYAAYAASQGLKTIGCVRTKSLQSQYRDSYDFTMLTGKGNYECLQFGMVQSAIFEDDNKPVTADLCVVDKEYKENCLRSCPYSIARRKFINSPAGILNYSKFLLDRPLIDDFSPDILFLDEAHELSDNIVIDFSGIQFAWTRRLKEYTDEIRIDAPLPIALKKGREWLEDLYRSLKGNEPLHPRKGGDMMEWKWYKRTLEKVDITLAALSLNPECWYINADHKRFLCKPKTSQFHFRALFDKAPKVVLMSATIQPQDIMALGIEDYEYITVPNTILAMMRPVYDLGGPKVTAKMTIQEQKDHIKLIANVFKDRPGWNGIIHVTSKKMASDMAFGLNRLLPNPIWIPDTENGTGTEKSYNEWQEFNGKNEGAICIAWQFFAGADMGDVAINITARVPYPYFGDSFEVERFNYHPGQARVRVANIFEQQQGRNRRGFAEHYGPNARKFNAIADSKWQKLKSAMNRDFLQSIV